MLIDGNYGVGKTTISNLYLESKGYKVLYFDMTFYKNKQQIFNLIKESFNKCDIITYFQKEKKNFICYR